MSGWRCAIGLSLSSLYLPIGHAAADVCHQPADYSSLSFGYYSEDESNIEGDNSVDLRGTSFDLQLAGDETWTFGVGHRYDKFDFDPVELQTNGHLHTLYVPMHRQSEQGRKGFRFSVAPALTASSNVIDEPGEYSSDGFHLLAALIWSSRLSDEATFRYGLCGDNRFGEYQLYPSISFVWQPGADWAIELGFPMTRVRYQASPDISSSLKLVPDGNEWYVKDDALAEESQFVYEAILVDWSVDWRANERLTITASVGRHFDIDYEVTFLDGSRVRQSGDSATRVGAALAWRF